MKYKCENESATQRFGHQLGAALKGGEIIELVGDVGVGKTTFTKAIAAGLDVEETIQSPTFTISQEYDSPRGIRLCHYDFYRLHDAGIMKLELDETLCDAHAVTVIEWSDIITDILPSDRLTIEFQVMNEASRTLTLIAGGPISKKLIEVMK